MTTSPEPDIRDLQNLETSRDINTVRAWLTADLKKIEQIFKTKHIDVEIKAFISPEGHWDIQLYTGSNAILPSHGYTKSSFWWANKKSTNWDEIFNTALDVAKRLDHKVTDADVAPWFDMKVYDEGKASL